MLFFINKYRGWLKSGFNDLVIPFILIFSIVLPSFSCKNPSEVSISLKPDPPIANAGPDQESFIGSYVILDASGSTSGNGNPLTYNWTADEGNPAQQFVPWFEEKPILGFTVEGIYRFFLRVNNEFEESGPDTVVIQVGPRKQFIFEDPKLEIRVRYRLGIPQSNLTGNDLLNVDTLNMEYFAQGITSLSGIENCRNLVKLNMCLQKISGLNPLSELTKLEVLYLDQNRIITDISPLAGLVNLKKLMLFSNQITDISPLANLTSLKYLNLLYNPLNDISSLGNMLELEELLLSDSAIGDISIIGRLIKLRQLWLSDCQISDITPIQNLNDLEFIYLCRNQITNISPLSGCVSMIRLYLSDNQIIETAPLKPLTNLNILDLDNNQISNLLPLVENIGLNYGDAIGLRGNPLDSMSIHQYISNLINRGVFVFWP